jgi:uroporphyrinogen-III synthase
LHLTLPDGYVKEFSGPVTGLELAASIGKGLAAAALRQLASLPLFVVGARTADAASAMGLGAPKACAPRAADLVPLIASACPPPGPLLYLAGETRKPGLETALAERGYRIEATVVYAARESATLTPTATAALRAGQIDAVLHYSGRSASLFTRLAAREGLAAQVRNLRHVCISAEAAQSLEGRVVIAATPDSGGLFAALEAV